MKRDKKTVCRNKKARHDYFIDEVFDAGMVLLGPEVKSLREGRANLADGYAKIRHGEVYLYNTHISPYPFAGYMNLDPMRTRKLLLTKKEIKQLIGKTEQKGYSLIPIEIYFHGAWAKVNLALAKGKRKIDKRHTIKERDIKREMDQARKKGGY